jgi:ubiquinone/menaquinone biosynthesis C-methylase UbiE
MNPSLLPWLVSPDDGSPLTLKAGSYEDGELRSGTLTDEAGRSYPIEDGIPRLLPGALLDAQRAEIAARDAQVEAYDAMSGLHAFGKVEIPMVLRRLQPQPSDRLLEAGCGTGRMTPALAGRVRELVAVDFSFESLRANAKKLQAAGIANVHLVQADLCRLPFASAVFDRIVSCQVLEHVPGDTARRTAVAELARVGRPQTTLVLSAYQHSPLTRLFGRKEGEHDGGIPFFRFTRSEFRETLSTAFSVESVTGALVYLYLARCRSGRGQKGMIDA